MTASPLIPVPIPDRVAVLIGSCMPAHVLRAEIEADTAVREVALFRDPLCADDRADREQALSVLARANKVLAAHHPRLVIRPGSRY
ncbi:hypothetical protein GCM10010232_17610 [Streptomyces amakusaensis]|uniref:Uncharacterized protein n=1 Tax=Streptomyces amakusaensis TaxID=67271 RepID=A0ABW0AMV4_9ACTN